MKNFLSYAEKKSAEIIASGVHNAKIASIYDGVITGKNSDGYVVDNSADGIAVVFELESGLTTYLNRLYAKETVDVNGEVRLFKEVDGFISKMKEIGVAPEAYIGAKVRIATKGQFVQDILPVQKSVPTVKKW